MSDALNRYYADRAPEYESIYAKPERQSDLRSVERWVEETFRDRVVLEVACGTGYWTRCLERTAKSLLAVDASQEVIASARVRAATPVAFTLGDAYRLPVRTAQFDAAFAGFWYSHVPRSRIAVFLAELHRTLRPGARVAFLDNRFVADSSTPLADRDYEGNTYQLRTLRDGSAHRVLKNFPSEADLRAAVASVGRDIRFRNWQYYWALEYTGTSG